MVEIVFLMLVLKLPLLYLIAVVWWAVRAEPRPPEPAVLSLVGVGDRPVPPRNSGPRRSRRGGPHGHAARQRVARAPLR